MPQQHTPGDQVKFLSQWFLSWSEMQREDFLPVLLQAYQPRDHLNGLVGSYEALGTRGRRPSLFDCQMKLFHDWFTAWTETDRQTLLEDLRELDPEFMRQYEKRMADPDATTTQDDSISGTPLTSTSAAEESQDSSQNPSSSISSPPSTLPRSHSPHDSGLEDSTIDSEHVDSDKKNEAPGDDSNTTTITINTDSNTTTINTASPPPPPAKPSNNVTVVEVGGESTSGGEGVFNMQELANGLIADGQSKVSAGAEAGQMSPPTAASPTQPSQECEAVSAEH